MAPRKSKPETSISLSSLPGPSPWAINVLHMKDGVARIEAVIPSAALIDLLEVLRQPKTVAPKRV